MSQLFGPAFLGCFAFFAQMAIKYPAETTHRIHACMCFLDSDMAAWWVEVEMGTDVFQKVV